MTDIENSVAFTKNSDNSLTWKALSYTDEE